ncbi:RNA polymerase sigma-70 factor (ECF subfamily) [Algoriphagus zhangzhouensis]|uniref:RNA polymerase sigma-70 factor, ECF subfamily n=2 Tax=Algoriphagus zhangzhouensis TaxID=1073327 RepID=A0A1M7Z8C9_9BACT|nr:RNA polymerase sigma-70 factor (ECF subfamily) [Algoriphagus zhangzhouensis]SHO60966.1 RNA polymerase sigma-70 factor, ECF subfamily [Algoriphagus zhangzhouensis]
MSSSQMNCLGPEIAKNLQNGCQKAFEEVYNQYHKKIFGFCIKYGLNQSEAEEITQIVFIKVWENRNKIDPEKKLYSYILTMSKNIIIDSFKAKIKYQAAKEYQMNFMKPVNNVEQNIHLTELQSSIEEALTKLPERRREVFELSRIQGLSNKEIANQLGISIKTVENHLNLALQDFKEVFKEEKVGIGLSVILFLCQTPIL